ncbi:MAG: polysaccharide pyruvyl transferase family protein [Opitutaceae bacterium]|nr:polysaccharide pyruvyl transferase family protein [Opitutaceae bacterium]
MNSAPVPSSAAGQVLRPRTLNLQAIDICNSRCVMCHIWKEGVRETMSLDELRAYLATPFFSEVRHVGITGGEPTLRKDLFELYALLPECLPALAGASFISHGMQTARAVDCYTRVHRLYRERGLEFSGMISLDGVGEAHDRVRGRQGAFAAASQTLLELKQAGVKVMAACTIVRSNVYALHELLDWGRAHGVYVRFRVAEFIRRLYNEACAPEIRCFSERELRHLVCFFHVLLTEYEKDETIRRTYRSVVELLTGGERLIGCPYQKGNAVNISSRGELAACAPKGESLARADDEALHALLAAQRETITRDHCAGCIHDYHDGWNAAAARQQAGAEAARQQLYQLPDEAFTTSEQPAAPFDLAGRKRLLLVGWYGTETAGDIAIIRGIMAEYLAVNPALEFGVLSLYPAYTRTTVAAWPRELQAKVAVADYLSREALDSADRYDGVVMAGGPLMDIPQTREILALFKRFSDRGKPCVIEGCGVGPLHRPELRWNVCRLARLATRISVRDHASRDLLRLYGIRKSIEVRDDPAGTFLRAHAQPHHGRDRGVIRCFLRELTSEYPQALTSEQATAGLVRLVGRLLEWYPEHRVELWAMHHFPVGKDDRVFARELQRRVGSPRLHVQWEPSTPEEIMAAMAGAEFCVCMRFHSCVFAAAVGVPFLAIDYTAGGKIRAFLEDNRHEARMCGLDALDALTADGFRAKVWPRAAETTAATPAAEKPHVLHVIQTLSGGGGARAMISLVKYSRRLGGPEHRVVSLARGDAKGLELAAAEGIPVLDEPGPRQLARALAAADIVLVHWWNCPEIATFFRRELPPMRLAIWAHVAGYHSPHLLTPGLVNFVDSAVACSPHTFAHPAFRSLPPDAGPERAAMILAGAEFDRLRGIKPRAHQGFRVGFIGFVDPSKMHPDYATLSCAVKVPNVRFVVCGSGGQWLAAQVAQLGRADSFEFRGNVEDIRSVIETLDVYGYPLCEDTYAAAELNLQEVMYAGLPVVAFPHGGIGSLIRHGETGLLVNTAEEYARAIEHLHQHPEERARLGANAAAYAREHFGAERTGREFNAHFAQMLLRPKRERQWGSGPGFPPAEDPERELAAHYGARFFVESIGELGADYRDSLLAATDGERLEADNRIGQHSLLTHYACSLSYRKMFPNDPALNFWAGLSYFARGKTKAAFEALTRAWRTGFSHWRIHWYCALAAEQEGRLRDAFGAVQRLLQAMPELDEAKHMQQRLVAALTAKVQEEVRRAQELLKAGRNAEARVALQTASDLMPGQVMILELLADLDCRLGNLGSARTLLGMILAREPGRDTPRLQGIRRALEAPEARDASTQTPDLNLQMAAP